MKRTENEHIFIYGRHAVLEALTMRPDTIVRVFVREDVRYDNEVRPLLKKIETIETFKGNNVPRGVDSRATHQGFIAEVDTDVLLTPFADFKQGLEASNREAIVLLGEVQDPHNVGAIIRSAAAFGAKAVLIPEHRGCPVTGTVIKTSAGTAFTVPLVSVPNVNNALRDLQEAGYWVYGLDGEGDVSLEKEAFTKPSVFVVGNEATGLRQKTHEKCDCILSIPIDKKAESLNASVSAAVVLYAWSVQH